VGTLVLRAILSLGAVIGLMAFVARGARKRLGLPGTGRRSTAVRVEILGRQQVAKSASVAVVRTAGRALIIGITEGSVTVLADADLDALEAPATDEVATQTRGAWTASLGRHRRPQPAWKALIELAQEKTVRRA